MNSKIDLRSDTVTKPTEEMREAAKNAEVGDDVFGDDPSVNELEKYAARLVGKEAALYVTSGTQGNLVSILSQTSPGDEVLLEEQSHIYFYEVGGLSAVGGTIPKLYPSDKGYITADKLKRQIRGSNIHFPNPRLFCLENTHNRHGGVALHPDQVKEMAETAKDNRLNVHLDGARIFNAVTAHNTDIKEYTKHVDSIQFCLSKGLSAPVGSIVAGDEEFIQIARKKRKMLGGGMRQAGIIAAPGLIALQKMRDRLHKDHENAKKLAYYLDEMGLDVWPTETNIVVCDISSVFDSSSTAIAKLEKEGVLVVPFGDDLIRITTHREISEDDIDTVIDKISKAWF